MIRLWVVVVLLAGCGDDGGGGGGDDAGPADAGADGGSASCSADPDCDDGVHCNGAETCDRGECEPGVPVACDDGMECTDDACDEAARGCAYEPRDADGDGHGDVTCGGDDCDDADPMRHPGATEVCDAFRDEDCDASTLGGRDEDTDGHVAASCCNDSVCGADCDDTSADAHLGASEACDGSDNDCDSRIDEEVERTFHRDADGDMFGDPAGPTLMGCTMPAGYSENATDCDDANPGRNPGAPEVCDGADNDCDPRIDESVTTTLWIDMDMDMFGNPFAPTTTGCPRPGYADNPRDCDDGNGSVNPATSEVCNMIDDNCDGRADEGVEPRVFYADCDGDTYGSATRTMTSCTTIVGRPAGCLDVAAMWTSTGGDCDDTRRATYPGAPETCNAIDDDCSGSADDMGADAWCSTPEGLAGLPNTATGTCRSGACAVATCTSPYLDCSAAAGCETDSQTDASHCGRCGMVCPLGCMAGMCRTGYAEIALGWSHSCGRLGREVQCWGSNARGQLGDGTTMNRLRRTLVMGVTDATQITGGGQHTCALLSTGRVMCWGHNFFGQLGDGAFTDRAFALPPVMGLTDATEVGAGDWHTCALRSGGGVACWGTSNGGRLGDGPHPGGYARSMAGPVTGLTDAIDLGVGMRHTCAVRRDGSIVCWGTNDSGQLGDRTRVDRDVPVAVMGITNAVAVAPGHGHTCALLADRTVQCWGLNNYGQLGDGTTTTRDVPTPVIGVDEAVAITSGNNRTCVIRVGGGMWCWGENVFGGIGDGTTANRPLRVAPVGITSAVRVGIGDLHTCALTSDGRTQCWGRNSVGQLGDDTTVDHTTPAPIIPP